MSMSEKRYFNIYARRHVIKGKNQYISLFKAIEKLTTYDEKLVKEQYEKAIEQPSRHFASDKNYLYSLIIRSLSEYHVGKSVNLRVKEQLHQAEILYKKELYEQGIGLLEKALRQAKDHDLHSLTAEITYWKARCLIKLGKYQLLKENLTEASDALALLDNFHAFLHLYYGMLSLYQKCIYQREYARLCQVEKHMAHPYLEDENIPLTLAAKVYFFQVHYLNAVLTQDLKAQETYLKRTLSLMKEHPFYVREHLSFYVFNYRKLLELLWVTQSEEFVADKATYQLSEGLLDTKTYSNLRQYYGLIDGVFACMEGKWDRETILRFSGQFEQVQKACVSPFNCWVTCHIACALWQRGEEKLADRYFSRLVEDYPFQGDPNAYFSAMAFWLLIPLKHKDWKKFESRVSHAIQWVGKEPYIPQVFPLLFRLWRKNVESPEVLPGALLEACIKAKEVSPWLNEDTPYLDWVAFLNP